MASVEIANALDNDCYQLINGLNQCNEFLIQRTVPKVQYHSNLLDNLLPFCETNDDRDLLLRMRISMQQLIDASSEMLQNLCSISSNTENKALVSTIAELEEGLVVRLRKSGLPWSKVAAVFGLSRQSMYNFRKEYGINEPNIALTDSGLMEILPQIMHSFPAAGAVSIRGILLANGYTVNVNKIKAALRLIDPAAVERRRRAKIYRRVYFVEGPNIVWHIDGTHKLVMFRLIVHGGIDGYSKQVLFLWCSTNNKAETVLQLFQGSVKQYGLPRRVRADKGIENFAVKDYMEEVAGEDRGSFMTGPSVHNTPIERLWRDVNEQVIYHYKDLFLCLEETGFLDENSVIDVLCLHYVFLPRINFSLNIFKFGWNCHSMSTKESRTPEQSWLIRMIQGGLDVDDGSACAMQYNPEYWLQIHLETFKSELETNVIIDILNRCIQIVPDPTSDDHDAGLNYYKHLRNHFVIPA